MGTQLSSSAGVSPRPPAYCVGIVTFRRLAALRELIASAQGQSLPPAEIIVADNAADPDVAWLCDSLGVTYLAQPENGGPAGGTAAIMRYFIATYGPGSWLTRVDDDRLLEPADLMESLLRFGVGIQQDEPDLGGVGLRGAVSAPTKLHLVKPPIPEHDPVRVDYLATGFFPLWPWEALERAGVLDEELFFGMTEVEFGLRQTRAGLRLFSLQGPFSGSHPSLPKSAHGHLRHPVTWRLYYSTRNSVLLGRRYFGWREGVRLSLRFLGRAVVLAAANPRWAGQALILTGRGVIDGWFRRLGRRIDPFDWAQRHHRLGADGQMPST